MQFKTHGKLGGKHSDFVHDVLYLHNMSVIINSQAHPTGHAPHQNMSNLTNKVAGLHNCIEELRDMLKEIQDKVTDLEKMVDSTGHALDALHSFTGMDVPEHHAATETTVASPSTLMARFTLTHCGNSSLTLSLHLQWAAMATSVMRPV